MPFKKKGTALGFKSGTYSTVMTLKLQRFTPVLGVIKYLKSYYFAAKPSKIIHLVA